MQPLPIYSLLLQFKKMLCYEITIFLYHQTQNAVVFSLDYGGDKYLFQFI